MTKLRRIIAGIAFIFAALSFTSCGASNDNSKPIDNPSVPVDGPSTPVTPPNSSEDKKDEPTNPIDDKKDEPTGPSEEEIRNDLISKANTAITSLESKNMTIKIDDKIYKIDNLNADIDGVVYESIDNKYNVYTLADEEELSYKKTESSDKEFSTIQVGEWNNIFTIGNELKLDSVEVGTNAAYIAKKGTGSPLFAITYKNNGFTLSNETATIEFYDIGSTTVTIPTNIAEDEYIVKDGKYNLSLLKTVLTDWVNGDNKEKVDIIYERVSRNLVDIKLIDFSNGILSFYAEAAAMNGRTYLSYIEFKDEDINNAFENQNLKLDDFKEILYEKNPLAVTYKSPFEISKNVAPKHAKISAKNALVKDGINADVVFAYETVEESGDLTYGITYKMACFTADGNYYEYEVNALDKLNVYDNDTSDFDVIQKVNKSVLIENLDLYK